MVFGNHLLNNHLLGVLRPGIHLPRSSLLQGAIYLHKRFLGKIMASWDYHLGEGFRPGQMRLTISFYRLSTRLHIVPEFL